MSVRSSNQLGRHDVEAELKATIEARRELGPDLEDHILEGFLARIQERVDARVEDQLAARPAWPSSSRHSRGAMDLWVVPASLGVAIPLCGIAGSVAAGPGILVVMSALVIILLLYFIDRWIRFHNPNSGH